MAVDLMEIPTDDERLVYPINRSEMELVRHISAVEPPQRHCVALARRGRGRGEARRFAHSGDLACRMPDLFTAARLDGRLSVEHLDRIWLVINRHVRELPVDSADAVSEALDLAVETAVLDWMDNVGESFPVAVTALGNLAEEVILTLDADLVADTEDAERERASVVRRDNRIILDCGNSAVANRVWSALNDEGWRRLQEIKKECEVDDLRETLSECRAAVLLEALGDDPERIVVSVNLYRTTIGGTVGHGPGFIPGVGWVSPAAAELLEECASTTRLLSETPDAVDAYQFPVKQKAELMGRDAHCRFPFCTVPADQCEFDHIVNSPHTDPSSNGPTAVSNGQCLCRLHHKMKTLKLWRSRTDDDGHTIEWTGPDGCRYITHASGPLVRTRPRMFHVEHPS